MEAATLDTEVEGVRPEAEPEILAPSGRYSADTPFRYSTWVHVGPGAENCEEGEQGTCADPLHFHAWCRLPNQFQHRKISETAKAARARRVRQLRDPQSDAYAVLEEDLDELARLGADAKADLVEELLSRDWPRDYMDAWNTTLEIEADEVPDDAEEPPKLYEHIEEDQRRFGELEATAPDQRPQDEYESLKRHLVAHKEAVDAALAEIVKPRREALDAKDLNGLIDMVREQRIAANAHEEFMHTYHVHSWLHGARKKEFSTDQVFKSLADLEGASPEAIEALKLTYNDLERAQAGGAGNS